MDEAKPTPTPWTLANGATIWAKNAAKTTILIARLPPEAGLDVRRENGRLIVRAVNCFDELFALLQEVLSDLEQRAMPNVNDEWFARARAVIAKAKGN